MNICIIGSGNVAHHISKALYNADHKILQVYSRNLVTAKAIAKRVDSAAISDIQALDTNADLYLIAVSDDAIEKVASLLPFKLDNKQIIAHTAGSISIDTLHNTGSNYGSFYPLQTFSKSRRLSFTKIPMCIHGSTKQVHDTLTTLAQSISSDVRSIDDTNRKQIHLSAVFACNFVNHLIAQADDLLEETDIDRSILFPLIQETIAKAQKHGARQSQTGPAVRGDKKVMNTQERMLEQHPAAQKLYKQISASIKNKITNENYRTHRAP